MIPSAAPMNKARTVVVVVGMHRSGTSAITRALRVLGVDLGNNLMPATRNNNDKGFFEDKDVCAFNMSLMRFAGHDWDTLAPIALQDVLPEDVDSFRRQAIEMIGKKTRESNLFGLKDPRISRLLPFWQDVFDRGGYDVRYVIALRHPLSVAQSLKNRDGFEWEKSHYLWLQHIVPAVIETRHAQRVVVDYDRLMESPSRQAVRIARTLDLPPPDPQKLSKYKKDFLDVTLRHTLYPAEDLERDPSVPESVARAYALLAEVSADSLPLESPVVTQQFAQFAAELAALRPAFEWLDRRNRQVITLKRRVAALEEAVGIYQGSTSWRVTAPLRALAHRIRRIKSLIRLTPPIVQQAGGFGNIAEKAIRFYRHEGISGIKRGVLILHSLGRTRDDYRKWVRRYDTLDDADRAAMRAAIKAFARTPLIAVVMPIYNPRPEWLVAAIESVRRQIYPHWELCIADDASTDAAIRPILERYAREDPRVKVVFREQNGHISAASNSALELVTAEWVALVDHDDVLAEHALFWVADAAGRHPEARLIYSDEDKLNADGQRCDPYFKCDWNIDLFYSHNLITHLGVYHTALVREIGGFREGFEGAQDYDLALRCSEHLGPGAIHHIPRVLYHWRVHSESTAQAATAKPYAMLAGERALNEHLRRRGIAAEAELIGHGYRMRYALPASPPLVSLIIPTRNGMPLIRRCVASILEKTTYANYEILIVDNGSDDPATLRYFEEAKSDARVRVVRDDRPFNFSALNNAAVKRARGALVGLVNDDIEVITPDWLGEMASLALQPAIGAVGARLLYPDGTLQHGGVILGLGGVAGHSHKHLPRHHPGYFFRATLLQSFSAVTAACVVIRKSVYEEVGGLNETDLAVAFNDVDFCLRVGEAGYRTVWTPYAELYHHESASRGMDDAPEKQARFAREIAYMKKRWGQVLLKDPAYSPNLTFNREDFSRAWPPRVAPLASPVRKTVQRIAAPPVQG